MVKVCKRPPLLNIFPKHVLDRYKLMKEKVPGYSDPRGEQALRIHEFLHSKRNVIEEEYRVGLSTDNAPDHECPFGSKNLFYKFTS